MEIKLSVGDIFTIPSDCKAIIEEGKIIIEEKLEKKPYMKLEEFKDGDILIAIDDPDLINIFKSYQVTDNTVFSSYYCYNEDKHNLNGLNWIAFYFRHATEEEQQKFFDKLKAKGLKWNAETKTIERIRDRVEKGGKYLFITGTGNIRVSTDDYCDWNDEEFNSGNYYLLSERAQAEKDAKSIKEVFAKRLMKMGL